MTSFADQASTAGQGEQENGFQQGDKPEKAEVQANDQYAKLQKRLDDKDEFIETLKSERKADAEKMLKLEQQLQELQEQWQADRKTNENVREAMEKITSQREVSSTDRAEVNLDEVVEKATQRLKETMTAEQMAAKQAENFSKVEEAVKGTFGSEFMPALTKRCEELGMSLVELDNLAKAAPQAAIELLMPKAGKSTAPTTSSANTAGFNQKPQQQKPKTVMGASTSKDDIAFWRACAPE